VLVVDDDTTVRTILGRLLQKRFDAVVREAPDGYAAFIALAEEVPDLLLLDVTMPIVDGPELLEKIRADPKLVNLPVVAISAAGERDVVTKMIELGVLDYLRKPLNLTLVEQRLRRTIASIGAPPSAAAR
jgi:CheY-like chemotaxis protein